jgi:hypothetical protein
MRRGAALVILALLALPFYLAFFWRVLAAFGVTPCVAPQVSP